MGAKHRKIAFEYKLGVKQLEELHSMYGLYANNSSIEDEHELLLVAHVQDMYLKLDDLKEKIIKTVKLTMTNSEALAFFQFWNVTDTSKWPLANVIVHDMVGKIDKKAKNQRLYAAR